MHDSTVDELIGQTMLRIFFFIVFSVSLPCFGADLVRQPAGLKPGDRYRLFFTTSQSRDASSPHIAEYHDFVQSVADAAPEVGSWGLNWSAVAGTPGATAWDNSGTDPTAFGFEPIPQDSKIPTYRVDGELIWFDYQHMWNFLLDGFFASPTVTDLGTIYEGEVWTGTRDANETGTFPLGTAAPYTGITTSASRLWNGGANQAASTELLPLYAISNVITVVPEPGSISLLMPACLFRRRSRGQ